jgi:hypothetical protein
VKVLKYSGGSAGQHFYAQERPTHRVSLLDYNVLKVACFRDPQGGSPRQNATRPANNDHQNFETRD